MPTRLEPGPAWHRDQSGTVTNTEAGTEAGAERAGAAADASWIGAGGSLPPRSDTESASAGAASDASASMSDVGGSASAEADLDAGAGSAVALSTSGATRAAGAGWRSNLDQLMPVVLFLVFYNLVNTVVAVTAATAWSIKAAYSRHRRGLRIGAWLPTITVYLIVRAAVSIAVERDLVDFGVSSEAVYFGIGIGTKMLVGVFAVATILIGRPMALWLVRLVVDLPEAVRTHSRFVATMSNVTWVIAFYEIGSSIWDIWLFNNSGVSLFLVTRQVVNLAVAFVLIFVTLLYVDRRLSSVPGWPGMVSLLDRSGHHTDATAAAPSSAVSSSSAASSTAASSTVASSTSASSASPSAASPPDVSRAEP